MSAPNDPNDRRFTPFNFSDVVPMDSLAAALAELPLPRVKPPFARNVGFQEHELRVAEPSVEQQHQMLDAALAASQEWYVAPLERKRSNAAITGEFRTCTIF